MQVPTFEDPAAVAIDRFTLAIQNIVILEHVLTLLGVAAFNLALGRGNGLGDQLGLQRHIIRHGRT